MTSARDITVVVPAYRAADFLARTLATVAAQTVQPSELIVVDDGSNDGTADIADTFAKSHGGCRVRVLREPHRGPGAARNAGVRATHTEWIAFLDADDLWAPEKLAVVTRAMNEHSEANFVCHNETVRFLDGSSRVTNYASGYRPEAPLPPQLYRRNFFSTSAVVCRRDDVLRWGGFDETLSSAQDYELWLRLSPGLKPLFVSAALGTYVLRAGNITTTRFWRRLRNGLLVRYRHRDKAGVARWVFESFKLTVLHLGEPLRTRLRKYLRPAMEA